MRPIEISDFNAADEFVVEAMMQDGKFKVIGKVIIDNNLLNDDDLETIWDYANWETNGYEKMVVSNGVYKGLKAFSDGRMFYVITDDEVGVVNDNIMVRKHYDVNNGYYIKSSRLHKEQSKDLWCFGSCETITNEYKSNILHEVLCGKATPNKEQLNEMNRTAKVVQAKQTQEREYEVQIAREKAERQKAKADKAYMEEMNLSAGQFINLKWIETVANKQGANIDVMVGPAESMWNIRRN